MVGTVFEEITLKNEGDEIRVECGVIKEPEIRQMTVQCEVDTGADLLLLGAIPLEDMDLMVDPKRLQLGGAHGDEPVGFIY